MMTLDIQGIAQVTQHLQRLVSAVVAPLMTEVGEEAKDVLQRSAELCPYLTGDLVRSGEVEGPEYRGMVVEAGVRYGDHGAVPYAAIQEFDVTFNHPGGGQAHFLQQAVFQATPGFAQRITDGLRAALR